MNEHYEQWEKLAPRGLALIGLGLSVTGSAISSKTKGRSFFLWVLVGIIGIVITNSGVSVFGEAVKHRALYDMRLQQLTRED